MKRRSLKSRKIEIFPMGLVKAFRQKGAIFPCFVFKQYRPGKFVLRDSGTKKTCLQTMKTRSLKSQKIEIFPKGLVHGFGQRGAIFPSFVFRQYRTGKCVLRYSGTKKRVSRL